MAAVSGPSVARNQSPLRRASKISARTVAPGHSMPDPFYGHEETAKLCAKFVTHLFACPELPPLSTSHPPAPSPPLANFIAYALHRTRLHSSVTFAALYLLQRLKARFPAARGSSGHRLFISAFMIASKVICDDTYSNKSWSIVGQGMFALREINQMEREMCSYLEWQLNIEPSALREFEVKVRRDFKGTGPYPIYNLPSPAPTPVPSTTPYGPSTQTQPSFAKPASPPKPIPPLVHAIPPNTPAYLTPPDSPGTPDTPEASHSTSTSPASSASPPTPTGIEDLSARIVTVTGSAELAPMSIENTTHMPTTTMPRKVPPPPPPAPAPIRKPPPPQTVSQVAWFAHASPSVW